ncbi:AAA family ATPase [Flavobacterium sp.]|uniref:AAA family ATPase n=1 Tax=Flavobacterium sp. TaxID=239 RepID=UPI0035B4E3F2
MIVGLLLRNIKTYQGINYIPITNKERLTSFVGNNGIGKSAILEALDSYFNDRTWNYNISYKKSGLNTANPTIIPIFFIEKTKISSDNIEIAEKLSNVIWEIRETDIPHINRPNFRNFQSQRNLLQRDFETDKYLLIPLGIDFNSNINLSIFNTYRIYNEFYELQVGEEERNFNENELNECFKNLYIEVKQLYQYIYIPKDINPTTFAKLETREIQALMGETLHQIIERQVTNSQITLINRNLNIFLDNLATELENYSFRTTTDRQLNLRKNDIYNLIIEAFFTIRKLHKKQGEHWLDITYLSSGEKQKAIIDVAHNLIKNHRQNTDNLIIAVDEPESSLHISACFEHFIKISEISENTHQFLFTTHWYGFLPILENCSLTSITRKENDHKFDNTSLANYREAIKQKTRETNGVLPYDLRLKSLNDFIQTVISSLIEDEPFNWLICEGSSEKIYFDYYFKEEINNLKLRIIPVGGANEIKRIYEHLSVSIDEFKKQINGKIAFISDTDADLVDYETKNFNKILIKRIVNQNDETKLVGIDSNPKSPKTEIEDCLNGKIFHKTLLHFVKDNEELLDFVSEDEKSEIPSYFAMNLNLTNNEKLTSFFDNENNKFEFAKKYIEISNTEDYKTPNWIIELKDFFKN